MGDRFFVFDFDGVLANSLPIALEEYRRIIGVGFPAIPLPYGPPDLAHIFPGPLRTSLRRFGLDDAESRAFFDLHSAAMRERAQEVGLFGHVVETFLELPPARRAIVTSAYSDAVRSILRRFGYETHETEVQVFGRELQLPKSQKFRAIATTNGVALDRIIKIGDMVSDILYARDAGIGIWAVGWGYHPMRYLAAFGPNECVETHEALRAKIAGG